MKKQIQILIALLALSFAAWGQSDRVKTVEVPDSASMVIFDTTGTNILGTDVQEAIEESNPLYPNHVWISETGGDNATGVLGDPHRAFADPWGAQDSLSGETNLSFLPFQGNYTYSGVGAGNEFTRADTFTLFDFSASNYSMLGVTGSNSSPFITDRTLAGSISTPKIINIFAPNSGFVFSDAFGLGIPIGVYNNASKLSFRAQSLTSLDASQRVWGIQSAAQYTMFEVDTMRIGGQVAISISNDFTVPENITHTRSHEYNVGHIYAGAGNTTDFSGLVRYQVGGIVDSISNIKINVGSISSNTAGMLMFASNNGAAFKRSTFILNVGSYYSRGAVSETTGLFNISTFNTSTGEISNSSITATLKSAVINGSIFNKRPTEPLVLSEKSTVNIEIGVARSTAVSSVGIDLENITLRDSSVFRIHCDYCEFEPSTIPIRLTLLNIPQGSRLEISGVYVSRGRSGEMIQITGANTDLSGVVLKDAVFINDGTAEWIEASTPTTIAASGVWTNSSTTINVDVAGNELWGFSDCSGTFRPLQEILDAGCDTASSAELTIFFTDTPPDTIELTTSYTVVEWQAGGADGPAIALSATGDSLMLDEGIYEIHYNIQAIFFAATTDYYIQPAIRQGAGVLNKSIRTAYNIWGADEEKATHIACTFRTEISADDTPIALVLAGDDNAAGGADVLIEKAILYVEKIE